MPLTPLHLALASRVTSLQLPGSFEFTASPWITTLEFLSQLENTGQVAFEGHIISWVFITAAPQPTQEGTLEPSLPSEM